MKFTINHVLIENFRAIQHIETDLWNKTIVSGPNESSKSTFASAITWCLFGRSIENDSMFEIVPFAKYGEVSPTVTIECLIDERPVTLQRVYKAKKARDGSFTGYETTTAINGIETGPRAFQDWISKNICDESIFRIVCNPKTFIESPPTNSKELNWQAQRRLLLSIIGGQQTDKEIAAGSNKWIDIVDQIDRFGDANTYLVYLKKRYATFQKDMDSFCVRIDQQRQNIKEVQHTQEEAETLIQRLNSDLQNLERENEEYRQSQRTADVVKFQEMQIAINEEIRALQAKYDSDMRSYENDKALIKTEISKIVSAMQKHMDTLKEYISALEKLKASKVREVCQTCGQKIDEKSIETAKSTLAKRIQTGESKIAELKKQIAKLQKQQKEYEEKEQQIPQPVFPAKIKDLQDKLSKLSYSSTDVVYDMDNYTEERRKVLDQQDQLKHELFIIENNSEIESIIVDIETNQRETVKELSEMQRLLELTKQFVSEKCSNAENAINALFENVKFKLFEKSKTSDDYRETCILTYNNIAYKDLSTSTKLIASLEIVKAFQKWYNVYAPIFCDNMESVTGDIETNAQTILFYVKEELCPKCGSHRHSRRKPNGIWECLDCHHGWVKNLEIKEQ